MVWDSYCEYQRYRCPSAIFHPLQNATMDHDEFRAMFCSMRKEEIGSEEVCRSTDYVFKKVYE